MSEWAKSEKSAEAYRTISEVAAELKLPQHVLRFWETRFPQVKPLKRAGGRRFYRPGDVALLRSIKALLYGQGYTIKGVQRMLREQGPRGIIETCAIGPGVPGPRPLSLEQDEGADMPIGDPSSIGRSAGTGHTGSAPRPAQASAPKADAVVHAGPDPSDLRDLIQAVAADLSECRRLIAAVRAPQN